MKKKKEISFEDSEPTSSENLWQEKKFVKEFVTKEEE